MKKYWNYSIAAFFAAITTTAFADTGTFLKGIGHAQYTQNIGMNTAGMLGLEGGPRNYRASGTFGWAISPCDRIKGTGEWLWQDIDYPFISGDVVQGANQGAAGLYYQHAFNDEYRDHFNLSVYYSHALSINLSNRAVLPISKETNFKLLNNFRHLAGSHAGGASPGYTTHPWQDTEITVAANWDGIAYDKIYDTKSYIHGFGATAGINQLFQINNHDFKAGTTVAWRAPFNSYQLEIDWIKPLSKSQLLLGLFGTYIQGKHELPNTSLVGLNLTFVLDTATSKKTATLRPFMEWMTSPAVYMSQVLVVPDQSIAEKLFPAPSVT